MQARCVVPQAMPVPLPYPSIFQPTVLRFGDLVAQEPHPSATGAGMCCCCQRPVLLLVNEGGLLPCSNITDSIAEQRGLETVLYPELVVAL